MKTKRDVHRPRQVKKGLCRSVQLQMSAFDTEVDIAFNPFAATQLSTDVPGKKAYGRYKACVSSNFALIPVWSKVLKMSISSLPRE